MAVSSQRPRPGSPPDLSQRHEVLAEVLCIEQARLREARRIEEERRIVFPETSVIVRDILCILDTLATPDVHKKKSMKGDARCQDQLQKLPSKEPG